MQSVPDFIDSEPAPVERPQPLAIIPGTDFDIRLASGPQGVIPVASISNAVYQASIALTADGLRQVAALCGQLLEQIDAAAPTLITPPSPGKLIVP